MSTWDEPSLQPCPMCGEPVHLRIDAHGEPVVTIIQCNRYSEQHSSMGVHRDPCDFAICKSECPPALWPLFLGIYGGKYAPVCEWKYDDLKDSWYTACGTDYCFEDGPKATTRFCQNCGKPIKEAETNAKARD